MDNLKEKLISMIQEAVGGCARHWASLIADYLIANGVTVQDGEDTDVPAKWIPVTERLPEDDLPKDTDRKQIRCLVATDKGTVKSCVRQRYQIKKNGQWCLSPWEWNKDLFAKPTHWMPLPEPPKKGGSKENENQVI